MPKAWYRKLVCIIDYVRGNTIIVIYQLILYTSTTHLSDEPNLFHHLVLN
jgi:hypothetical protein